MPGDRPALSVLAVEVRAFLAAYRLPGNPAYEFPPAPVAIVADRDALLIDLSEWVAWGPRRWMLAELERVFPGLVEEWTGGAYVFRVPGMRQIDRYRAGGS